MNENVVVIQKQARACRGALSVVRLVEQDIASSDKMLSNEAELTEIFGIVYSLLSATCDIMSMLERALSESRVLPHGTIKSWSFDGNGDCIEELVHE